MGFLSFHWSPQRKRQSSSRAQSHPELSLTVYETGWLQKIRRTVSNKPWSPFPYCAPQREKKKREREHMERVVHISSCRFCWYNSSEGKKSLTFALLSVKTMLSPHVYVHVCARTGHRSKHGSPIKSWASVKCIMDLIDITLQGTYHHQRTHLLKCKMF